MSLKVYASHPKCSLIRHQHIVSTIAAFRNKKVFYETKLSSLEEVPKDADILFYRSANYEVLKNSKVPVSGVHVYRDPRDMLVSGYFSSKYSHPIINHPKLQAQRELLEELDLTAGIISEIDYLSEYFDDMVGWDLEDPSFISIPFNALFSSTENTREYTKQILDSLGLVYSCEELDSVLADNSFKARSGGRVEGEEDVKSHYRKGVSGDWATYWSDEINTEFSGYLELLQDFIC